MSTVRFTFRYFEEILAGFFLVLISLATLANVVSRYLFNTPISWGEELARYGFIWLVFLGAALCTKHKRHICIDVVAVFLPPRGQLLLKILADAGVLTLMMIVIYYGAILSAASSHPTSTLGMPTYLVYMVAPLSALLVLIHSTRDLWRTLKSAFARGVEP